MSKHSRGHYRGATGASMQFVRGAKAPRAKPVPYVDRKPLKTAYCLRCCHAEYAHQGQHCAAGTCNCQRFER